jgi:hypothetical protein
MVYECFIFDPVLEGIARDVEDHFGLMMFHGASAPLQVEGGCFRGAGRGSRVRLYFLAAWAPPSFRGGRSMGVCPALLWTNPPSSLLNLGPPLWI